MSRRHRTRLVLLPLALLVATSCSDPPEEGTDEPCGGLHRYTREGNEAVTDEALLLAEAMASTSTPEVQAITDEVSAASGGSREDEDGRCGPNPEAAGTYVLVVHHITARPDAVSPELLDGLLTAARGGDDGEPLGLQGISLFVSDTEGIVDADYPGLDELRATVAEQDAAGS